MAMCPVPDISGENRLFLVTEPAVSIWRFRFRCQNRKCQPVGGMSALPDERTSSGRLGMSALCHKRTHAPQQGILLDQPRSPLKAAGHETRTRFQLLDCRT
jgi:hypothetical protein